jgi:hypothetical protein
MVSAYILSTSTYKKRRQSEDLTAESTYRSTYTSESTDTAESEGTDTADEGEHAPPQPVTSSSNTVDNSRKTNCQCEAITEWCNELTLINV